MLEQALAASGHPLRVYAGMRNWHPYIADVVHQICADGITRLIAICLAPQNSRTSIGLYRRSLTAALESDASATPIALTFVEEWPEEPALIDAFTERLIDRYPSASGAPTPAPLREAAKSHYPRSSSPRTRSRAGQL